MNEANAFDEFDEMLRDALRAQPVPAVAICLADEAVRRARRTAVRRLRWWNLIATGVAGALLCGLLATVAAQLDIVAMRAWLAPSAATAASSHAITWPILGGVLLLCAVVALAVQAAIGTADDRLPWATR